MAAEMAEQPDVLGRLAAERAALVARVRAVVPAHVAGTVLIARGSSDHAAIFGRYAIELASGRPVALSAPSLHTLYGATVDYSGNLAEAVIQSGRTPDIVAVAKTLARSGARTVAVTNSPSSPLGAAVEVTIPLDAGEERAVPATKTFTAQLAAFSFVAEAVGRVSWGDSDWRRLPEQVSAALDDDESPRAAARAIGDAGGLLVVGRGFMFAVALEAALKLKETAGILAEGYSAADLRHGPIAVVQTGVPVLAFRTSGPAAKDMDDLIRSLRDKGAQVITVSDENGDIPLPRNAPEPLALIPAAVRAQQIALELARLRGMDPDSPAGLSKVTLTR
jgi:glucosamine--fructose-6-phosphate aminotransferase (isomerizing)